MANVPGVVTDPSRIKGGVDLAAERRRQIAAYVATTEPARQLPRHRRDPGSIRPSRSYMRPGAALRQYRLQRLAPALYWRRGAPQNPDDIETVLPVMFGLPDSEAVQDLEAAADYLRACPRDRQDRRDRVLLGGRHAVFACSSGKIDAAIDCWGGFIDRANPDGETNAGAAEGTARHGRSAPLPAIRRVQQRGPEPAGRARSRAEEARPGGRQGCRDQVYQNAGHAFLADYRPSYREGPAHELWGDIRTFSAST